MPGWPNARMDDGRGARREAVGDLDLAVLSIDVRLEPSRLDRPPRAQRMIIGPCRVITGGPEPRVLEDAGVQVSGAHIAQIGPIGVLAAARSDETIWPARGRLLMPGYVNGHAHLARHLARGLALSTSDEWDRYDRALAPEDVHWASLAALVEGLRHGVTTTCDLHRSGGCLDLSLFEVTGAAAKLGVRVASAYAAAEEDPPAERRAALAECVGLAGDLKRERSGRLRALLGVRARTAEGLSDLLAESAAASPVGLAVHVELGLQAAPRIRWNGPRPRGRSLWAHAERAPLGLPPDWSATETLGVIGPGAAATDAEVAWGSDSGVQAPPLLDESSVADPAALEAHYRKVHVHGARWAADSFGEALGVLEPGAPADLVLVDY